MTPELKARFEAACNAAGEIPADVIAYLAATYCNAAEAMQQAIQEDAK